jgi:citronellyl-CoA dehydrogenase
LTEKWAELQLQRMATATSCGVRRLFSSSSRAVRLAAAPIGARGTWRRSWRELSTSSVWRAGVDPAEESVFGQDHVEMREALNKFIDREINPFVDEWENARGFPSHELFKKLGSAGFLGINRDPEYGGLGLDFSYNMAVAEELGNIRCSGVPMAIGVQTDMAVPALARYGSHELKKSFLAPSIAGDFVACVGVSEPGAGSDVANIRTNAKPKKDSDDLVINGSKMWITNGAEADWICLLATTNDGPPHRNKSLICVPMDTPGVTVARKIDKLGNHCSDTAEIFFEDVVVPASNVIGEEGQGFTYQMIQFQEERMWAIANGESLSSLSVIQWNSSL